MVLPAITDFLVWWLDELALLVPARLKRSVRYLDLCIVRLNGETVYRIDDGGSEGLLLISSTDPLMTMEELKREARRRKKEIRIIFERGKYHERENASIRLPLSRFISAACLDLKSNTPFQISDVYIGLSRGLPKRYFILKRSDLASIKAVLNQLGIGTVTRAPTSHQLFGES